MNTYIEQEDDIIHETSVDFVLRPVFNEVHLVQYDEALPVVKVNLFKNGTKYALPNNAKANVRFYKSDRQGGVPVSGCSADRKALYFAVTSDMSASDGKFTFVIELVYLLENNSKKCACSSPIFVTIDRNPIQNRPTPAEQQD